MDRSSVTLKDPNSKKTVTISSTGDTNANIIIPIRNNPRPDGDVVFNFIDQEEIGDIIAQKFSPGCILTAPKITHPINTSSGYHGGVTLEEYELEDFSPEDLVTTYYEFSKTSDFRTLFHTISKEANGRLSNLEQEDMANVGFGSPNEVEIGVNDFYYVRCKFFIRTYSSKWSNLGSFKYDDSGYTKSTLR